MFIQNKFPTRISKQEKGFFFHFYFPRLGTDLITQLKRIILQMLNWKENYCRRQSSQTSKTGGKKKKEGKNPSIYVKVHNLLHYRAPTHKIIIYYSLKVVGHSRNILQLINLTCNINNSHQHYKFYLTAIPSLKLHEEFLIPKSIIFIEAIRNRTHQD